MENILVIASNDTVSDSLQPSSLEHDYSIRTIQESDLERITSEDAMKSDLKRIIAKSGNPESVSIKINQAEGNLMSVTKKFAKCEECRKSRTKVILPESMMNIASSANDGKTCDFCGVIMDNSMPCILPYKFEGRRNSRIDNEFSKGKNKVYVACKKCGKVVLKESLTKHIQDVHEMSNKLECPTCKKVLAGPFSLKEHIAAVHDKAIRYICSYCNKGFSHFSNMNRHVRLVHENLVISSKYVNCTVCQKIIQAASLKKHMKSVHEKTRDHVCQHCSKTFTQAYTLKVSYY